MVTINKEFLLKETKTEYKVGAAILALQNIKKQNILRVLTELSTAEKRSLEFWLKTENLKLFARKVLKLARQGKNLGYLFDNPAIGDKYEQFAKKALLSWFTLRAGEVYIAWNSEHNSIFKVGMTRRSAEKRIKTLTTAGVLGKFELVEHWKVLDAVYLETKIHKELSKYKLEKEFFHADPLVVACIIEEEVELERQVILRRFPFLVEIWQDAPRV